MPKQIPQNELDVILNTISRFPEGIALGKLIGILKSSISRRKIQYRLAFLVKKGDLQAIGNARIECSGLIWFLPFFCSLVRKICVNIMLLFQARIEKSS